MSQKTYIPPDVPGLSFLSYLTDLFAAIRSRNSGATSPSETAPYMLWIDTANGVVMRRNSNDTAWVIDSSAVASMSDAKSGAYMLVKSDHDRLIRLTGSGAFTLATDAAATLGDGWRTELRNDSTGSITIDPNGSETVDGASSLTLLPGQTCRLRCTGGAFYTVGLPALATGAITNRIINGAMELAQIGSSFTNWSQANAGQYTLDCWNFALSGTGVVSIAQVSDAPTNDFRTSLRHTVVTADAAVAAGDYCIMQQPIEGINVLDLVGVDFTVSFWVRSSKTGPHCVALRNAGADRSYIAQYTINAANTWEKKSFTVSGGLPAGGTWNFTNGTGLTVSFAQMAGSTWQTTPGAWQSGNYLGTSAQVNVLDAAGNVFAITGVQLERGSTPSSFERRIHGLELLLCQRYFERLSVHILGYMAAGQGVGSPVFYNAYKRAVPTITVSSVTNNGNVASGPTFDLGNNNGVRMWVSANASAQTAYSAILDINARL